MKSTREVLINNISKNIRYKDICLNPNKYAYLNYDRTG
jgi:hypothetical protein